MERSSTNGKDILGAVIALLLFTLVAWSGIRNTANDLLLQQSGVRTTGLIIEADEEFDEAWHHYAVYEFTTRDGLRVTGVTRGDGPLRADLRDLEQPVVVAVEYLPGDPQINQLRADLQRPSGISFGARHLVALGILLAWVALGLYAARYLYLKLRARQSRLAA